MVTGRTDANRSGMILTGMRERIYRFSLRHNLAYRLTRKMSGVGLRAMTISEFIYGRSGADYGIGPNEKIKLVEAFDEINKGIESATSTIVQVTLAKEIFSIPSAIEGDIVECGCFKGASTAALSVVCELVKRRLVACDSFQGLPDDNLQRHEAPHFGIYGYYRKGMFCGRIEEVRKNISDYGRIELCEFVEGYYSESLQKSLKRPVAFAFLDVDLAASTYDCIRAIWPVLVNGGKIFTDDAGDMACVKPFFDDAWWRQTFACEAPGFTGSGCGIPITEHHSSIGYAIKGTGYAPLQRAAHLFYPDSISS